MHGVGLQSGAVKGSECGSSPCLHGSAWDLGTRGRGDSSPRSLWCPAPARGGSWGRRWDARGVVTTPWEPAAGLFCNCSLLQGGIFLFIFLLFAPISNPQGMEGNPTALQAPGTALHVPALGSPHPCAHRVVPHFPAKLGALCPQNRDKKLSGERGAS